MICTLFIASAFLFVGCGKDNDNIDSYTDLKSTIYDIQKNSEDLYRDEITIFGIAHSQYNGAEKSFLSKSLRLQDVILTENCLMTRPNETNGYYWFYFDINKIEFNNIVIWNN